MARYPSSVLDGTAADALSTVLSFHVPAGSSVLDPCCGQSIWWDPRTLSAYKVTRSDILPPYELDLFHALSHHPDWERAYDCVVYDPPYLVDAVAHADPREAAYGGYNITEQDLADYMRAMHYPIRDLLKPGGKIIVKCQDQYMSKERCFKTRHLEWMLRLQLYKFDLIDFYVYRYHRASPTAYQVKDRPCSVICHSYMIVASKQS